MGRMGVGICLCVWERGREREGGGRREREREGEERERKKVETVYWQKSKFEKVREFFSTFSLKTKQNSHPFVGLFDKTFSPYLSFCLIVSPSVKLLSFNCVNI